MLHVSPEVYQRVELLNADGHGAVFIHLDNTPGNSSVKLANGTELNVLGEDGDWGNSHSVNPVDSVGYMNGFLLWQTGSHRSE